jgi:hypothetical protein
MCELVLAGDLVRRTLNHASLRGLRALFVGNQKLEVTSGELPLFAQARGRAGLHERPGRDSLEYVVVPCEQLAQLRPNVGLWELWRHRQESTTRRTLRSPAGPASSVEDRAASRGPR